MNMINEQIRELRELTYAVKNEMAGKYETSAALNEAADTIESLSAKLADRERLDKCHETGEKQLIEEMAEEIENLYGRGTDLTEWARDYLESLADKERSAEDCKEERENLLKEGDIVQHFKRETVKDQEHSMEYLYIVEAIATHTETNEKLVVYRALYKNEEKGIHFNVFARPYDMFMEEVDHEKYPQIKQKYRFEKFEYGGEL